MKSHTMIINVWLNVFIFTEKDYETFSFEHFGKNSKKIFVFHFKTRLYRQLPYCACVSIILYIAGSEFNF